jgi:hypothetical protein
MQELLRRARGLIRKLQQQPTVRFVGSSSRDWLPPVLGPSDPVMSGLQTKNARLWPTTCCTNVVRDHSGCSPTDH